jgi:WhiB family redox-sensing transcriptional regulator
MFDTLHADLDGTLAHDNAVRRTSGEIRAADTELGRLDTTGLSLDLPCTEDPELFFAESPQDVEQAKAMCRGCRPGWPAWPARWSAGEPWGVWGGELLLRGAIVPCKRRRGRPRKDAVACSS